MHKTINRMLALVPHRAAAENSHSTTFRFCSLAISLSSLLALMCFLFAGCSSSTQQKASAATSRPIPVSVAKVTKQDLPVYLNGLGSVTASNTVSIKSRVDGQLVNVAFKEGQHVNRGELLAVIDPRPFEVQLSQMQAQLFKDQASLRDAKLNLDRFTGLIPSGIMSQQQVDSQHAMVDQLEGAVRADQAQIDNVKLQITYCHITAPISGRIGLRLVDPGNMVHASDQNALLVITQLEPIAVLFTLPEDSLPAVAQHLRQGPLAVDAFSRDNQVKLATGTLLTIDNEIDPATGTGRLKSMFDNKDGNLWPNQFVNVQLLLETRKNSTVVPSVAIQHGPQGPFVYVVKTDTQTAEVRNVAIGLTQGNIAAITNGLAPGELVVTDGQDKLQNGSKVDFQMGGGQKGKGGAGSSSGGQQPGSSSSGTTGAGTPAS